MSFFKTSLIRKTNKIYGEKKDLLDGTFLESKDKSNIGLNINSFVMTTKDLVPKSKDLLFLREVLIFSKNELNLISNISFNEYASTDFFETEETKEKTKKQIKSFRELIWKLLINYINSQPEKKKENNKSFSNPIQEDENESNSKLNHINNSLSDKIEDKKFSSNFKLKSAKPLEKNYFEIKICNLKISVYLLNEFVISIVAITQTPKYFNKLYIKFISIMIINFKLDINEIDNIYKSNFKSINNHNNLSLQHNFSNSNHKNSEFSVKNHVKSSEPINYKHQNIEIDNKKILENRTKEQSAPLNTYKVNNDNIDFLNPLKIKNDVFKQSNLIEQANIIANSNNNFKNTDGLHEADSKRTSLYSFGNNDSSINNVLPKVKPSNYKSKSNFYDIVEDLDSVNSKNLEDLKLDKIESSKLNLDKFTSNYSRISNLSNNYNNSNMLNRLNTVSTNNISEYYLDNFCLNTLLINNILFKGISYHFFNSFEELCQENFPFLASNFQYHGITIIDIETNENIFTFNNKITDSLRLNNLMVNPLIRNELYFQADILKNEYLKNLNSKVNLDYSSSSLIKKIEFCATYPKIIIFINFLPLLNGLLCVHIYYQNKLSYNHQEYISSYSIEEIEKYSSEVKFYGAEIIRHQDSDNFYVEPIKVIKTELFFKSFFALFNHQNDYYFKWNKNKNKIPCYLNETFLSYLILSIPNEMHSSITFINYFEKTISNKQVKNRKNSSSLNSFKNFPVISENGSPYNQPYNPIRSNTLKNDRILKENIINSFSPISQLKYKKETMKSNKDKNFSTNNLSSFISKMNFNMTTSMQIENRINNISILISCYIKIFDLYDQKKKFKEMIIISKPFLPNNNTYFNLELNDCLIYVLRDHAGIISTIIKSKVNDKRLSKIKNLFGKESFQENSKFSSFINMKQFGDNSFVSQSFFNTDSKLNKIDKSDKNSNQVYSLLSSNSTVTKVMDNNNKANWFTNIQNELDSPKNDKSNYSDNKTKIKIEYNTDSNNTYVVKTEENKNKLFAKYNKDSSQTIDYIKNINTTIMKPDNEKMHYETADLLNLKKEATAKFVNPDKFTSLKSIKYKLDSKSTENNENYPLETKISFMPTNSKNGNNIFIDINDNNIRDKNKRKSSFSFINIKEDSFAANYSLKNKISANSYNEELEKTLNSYSNYSNNTLNANGIDSKSVEAKGYHKFYSVLKNAIFNLGTKFKNKFNKEKDSRNKVSPKIGKNGLTFYTDTSQLKLSENDVKEKNIFSPLETKINNDQEIENQIQTYINYNNLNENSELEEQKRKRKSN